MGLTTTAIIQFGDPSTGSFTKELVSSSRFDSTPPQIKYLSDSQENALKHLIKDNGFFEAHPSCSVGGFDMFMHRLVVIMDGEANGVTWTQDCDHTAIPGLNQMAEGIESATS